MPTECTPDSFGFEAVEGCEVVAAFDGGAISSDAGALLLGATDRAINMMDRFASCFHDERWMRRRVRWRRWRASSPTSAADGLTCASWCADSGFARDDLVKAGSAPS
jgi:Transposase DDE domain group 1